MFTREIKLNRFLLNYFDKVAADIPDDKLADRARGAGHPPVWVLGHLAICAELGQALLGGELQNEAWVPVFGPRSSDEVTGAENYSKDTFVKHIHSEYAKLRDMVAVAPAERLDQPHGVDVLEGSLVETVGDLQAHLLTTHFSFHLAQLSGWRRAMGGEPLV